MSKPEAADTKPGSAAPDTFYPPPTRNAYVAMGQNWDEMSQWDRQVVRVRGIRIHTTACSFVQVGNVKT